MVVAASLAQAVDVQIGLNFTGSTLHLNAAEMAGMRFGHQIVGI